MIARTLLLLCCCAAPAAAAIDRHAVVSRHDITLTAADAAALDVANDVFQVGNGAFAIGVDVTSLQTFNASYTHLGLNTLADWGWHTAPFSAADATFALRNFNFTYYQTPTDGRGGTRSVPYMNSPGSAPAVVSWLMDNPHRLNLGQLSLRVAAAGGAGTQPLALAQLSNASQRLSLWEGQVSSNFTLALGTPPPCAVTPDNDVATFACAAGVLAAFPFASYGQPTGACPAGLRPSPACASTNASQVLGALCAGRATCSLLVNYLAGFGDPCPGQAKALAANFTCTAAPAPPPAHSALHVSVRTVVDPDIDLVSTHVQCRNASAPCPLALRLAFAYGSAGAVSGADWGCAACHTTRLLANTSTGATLLRVLDGDAYRVDCGWSVAGAALRAVAGQPHAFDLVGPGGQWGGGSLSCLYSPVGAGGALAYPVGGGAPWLAAKAALTRALLAGGLPLPGFPLVSAAAAASWGGFWGAGAFVDLASGSADPVALELERRVVLSRYLLRVNDAGAEPPQETGLLCNSWGGKHHNEMRFW